MHTKLLFSTFICCLSLSLQAQVIVNEYSAANLSFQTDNYGKHEDWIELYNPTNQAVNLSGWHLSDNENNPGKWTFPTGSSIAPLGYLVVWCSGRDEHTGGNYHSNFKFQQTKNKAEHIVLSDAAGTVLLDRKVKKTQINQSVGLKTDNGTVWGVSTKPTPGAKNSLGLWYNDLAKRPAMSQVAGYYPGTITLELTTDEPNAVIYYSLDGNLPTAASTTYSGPITISQTKVVKAVSISNDPLILPSFVEFNTYFINVDHTLPVVSVAGTQMQDLANGEKYLRPFGSFEYFGTDKDRKASVTGEVNSHGQDSWVNDQRSLDWVSRDEMGDNAAVTEVVFPEFTDRDEFQRLILRAAGDDNYPGGSGYTGPDGRPQSAHIRDAYTQNLAKKGNLHLDTRTGAKAILYLNGDYWGVYDLREIPDDHDYTDFNYGQGKFDLQFIKTWGWTWVEYWDVDSSATYYEWRNLWDYVMDNSMEDPAKFKIVSDQLDYGSLVDYLLVNSFANASDWLNYNTGWWRGMNPEGGHQKWGYTLWDLDATYAYYINYTGIPDTSATSPPCNVELITNQWSDPEGHVALATKLRENPVFNQFWITRQADLMKTTFSCASMLDYLDEVVASIEPEMGKHIARWGGTMAEWKKNVRQLRYFIERRCVYLPDGLKECYNLTGPFNATLRVKPEQAGSIRANTLTYANFPVETPIFGNIDLTLEALPDTGYVFDHWETAFQNVNNVNNAATSMALVGGDTITAVFRSGSVPVQEPGKEIANVIAFPTLFDASLTLVFNLPTARKVSIRLLDVLGREVKTLQSPAQALSAGTHRITTVFEGSADLAPGMYMVAFSDGYGETVLKVVKQ